MGYVVPVRATVAVIATVISLALLLSFKTPDISRPRTQQAVLPAPSSGPTGPVAGPLAPSPSAVPAPSPTGRYRDGQYTGQDIQTDFGDNQVKVVIVGGRITDAIAVQLPFDRPRSAYISQVAGPWLHDEVLKAQSAQIDVVSGATYTSEAYAQSVQSALDQAR